MKRGDTVRLNNGRDKGIILLSPSEVDGITMCMVAWNKPPTLRYTFERVGDLVLC